MIEQFKRRFNSLYWHQFALTAGMVLLTLLLLGVSFFTLSYGTTTADKRGEMRTRAELIAQVSADYFAAAGDASIDEGTALRKLADMASRMTDVDFLICSAQGNVLLTTDEELVGRSITIPQDIVDDILGEKALYQGRSNVSGTYSVKKFAVAVPVLSSESQLVGIVLAVMDESEIMQVWRSFIGMFLMTSAIILLISFLASSVTSMRQIKPITDMAETAATLSANNLSDRISVEGTKNELKDLALVINGGKTISGLPAGAITNPGIDAIAAALNPDQEYLDEGYYFFVTGNPNGDHPGEYFYAKTADEHHQNCIIAGWG